MWLMQAMCWSTFHLFSTLSSRHVNIKAYNNHTVKLLTSKCSFLLTFFYFSWSAIKGQVSKAFSVKDLPGYTQLKERKPGQGTVDEINAKDLKAELEVKEVRIEES